jgi:hypothetical protein
VSSVQASGQAAQGAADEVVQHVRGRRHHRGRAGIPEQALDARPAEGGAAPMRIAVSVTSSAASAAEALTSSTRSIASGRPAARAATVSSRSSRAWSTRMRARAR